MRITVHNANVVLVDVQERLLPVMSQHDHLSNQLSTLLKGLDLLGLRPLITEQYPEKLGATIAELATVVSDAEVFAKRTFSCFGNSAFETRILSSVKKKLVLCGIETHVCVLQTALDAIKLGLEVVIVEDAVSSRNEKDKAIALKRLEQNGVQFTTVESLLFELMQTSEHEKFKEVSKLIK